MYEKYCKPFVFVVSMFVSSTPNQLLFDQTPTNYCSTKHVIELVKNVLYWKIHFLNNRVNNKKLSILKFFKPKINKFFPFYQEKVLTSSKKWILLENYTFLIKTAPFMDKKVFWFKISESW